MSWTICWLGVLDGAPAAAPTPTGEGWAGEGVMVALKGVPDGARWLGVPDGAPAAAPPPTGVAPNGVEAPNVAEAPKGVAAPAPKWVEAPKDQLKSMVSGGVRPCVDGAAPAPPPMTMGGVHCEAAAAPPKVVALPKGVRSVEGRR